METTDRTTARAIAAARRIDVATAGEVQVERVAAVRRSRPIDAAVAGRFDSANVAAEIPRSRIPDSLI